MNFLALLNFMKIAKNNFEYLFAKTGMNIDEVAAYLVYHFTEIKMSG